MDNLKNKTYNAFAWDFIGKLSEQAVSFIISIFLARLLLPEEFGVIAMASVLILIAHTFVDMGLGSSLIQRKDVNAEHYGSVFYFNIFVGVLLFLIFYFLSDTVALFYNIPELSSVFKVLSFNFIINSIGNVQRVWLIKQLRYSVLTKSRVLSVILSGSIGIYMALSGYGVWSLVYQSIIGGIVGNLYIYFFTGWRPKLVFSVLALKELWSYGFRMFLSGLVNNITSQFDTLIIGKIFPLAELGYYNRAKSLNILVIKYTSGSLMSVLFPALSSVKDEIERYKNIVFKAFNILNVVTFFLLGFLFVTIDDIIPIVFSEKWVPSIIYFKIILLSGYGYPFSALLVNIISSKGNSKAFLKLEIIKQSMLVLNLSLGFLYGIEGFLYIRAIVTFFAVLLNIIYASKEIKVKIFSFYLVIIPYFLVLITTLSIMYFFNETIVINNLYLHFIANGIIFTFVYIMFNLVFKLKGINIIYSEVKQLLNERKNR